MTQDFEKILKMDGRTNLEFDLNSGTKGPLIIYPESKSTQWL